MGRLVLLLAAAVLVLSSGTAYPDFGDQLVKLLPDDGAFEDQFGHAVAISGTTAIVGAPLDDDSGWQSGSAYLFDATTGQQIAKLQPGDGAVQDLFGTSVAISGDIAIVGAYPDDDNGSYSGSAYLFDTTTGQQIAKLLPNDGAADDRFGNSVAISGTTAIVGALFDDDNGYNSGSAYLFDATTGDQIAKLLPDDGAVYERFGQSVAISGTTAIVGASQDDENGINSGSAYLFDSATGTQIAKLLPDDGGGAEYFGISVSISGTIAIVGAWKDHDNGAWSGSAYLFDTATGQQTAKLLPNDGAVHDFLGGAVGISDTTAVVGAFSDDDNGYNSGSAYLFDATTGRQIAKLLPDDGAANDWFGYSVAISGATAIVGALSDDDNGTNSGSAYLFEAAGAPDCPGDSDGDGMVTICHIPRGNPDNAHTITVGVDAVPAHLAHGDHCGPCEGGDGLLMHSDGDAGQDPCQTDLDDSGDIGMADLVVFLKAWGANSDHAADLNRDDEVGPLDLATLLASWGPCE